MESQWFLEMLNTAVLVNMQETNNYTISGKYNTEKILSSDKNTEPYQ